MSLYTPFHKYTMAARLQKTQNQPLHTMFRFLQIVSEAGGHITATTSSATPNHMPHPEQPHPPLAHTLFFFSHHPASELVCKCGCMINRRCAWRAQFWGLTST